MLTSGAHLNPGPSAGVHTTQANCRSLHASGVAQGATIRPWSTMHVGSTHPEL